jgi:outer membrane immunogenic protein
MKKLFIAFTAVAAFTGSAMAADMAPRTYSKAPMMAPVAPSWTGFYIFGGVGGGVWDANNYTYDNTTGVPFTVNQKQGGDGWFGAVGAGYDWQFNSAWVAGILADGQFGSLKGSLSGTGAGLPLTGSEKLRDTWAVGARLGYLVAPNVLSYVNGGFTQSYWSGSQLGSLVGDPAIRSTPSFSKGGWFVGGGVENNLNIFGISAPGWFMKTEYRAAYFGTANLVETNIFTGNPTIATATFKPFVQTISTSLVYRFNWSGPVVAKY